MLVKSLLNATSDMTVISETNRGLLDRPAYKQTDHIARVASGLQLPFDDEYQYEFSFATAVRPVLVVHQNSSFEFTWY